MASQRGIRLIQDQNLNLSFAGSGSGSVGGNVNGSKVQKRGPAGGRKPLGDLSNAGKQLSMNQTFKKQSSKGLNVIEEEIIIDSSKIKSNVTRKRSITKTADKAQSTSRKALTDISNSEKFSDSEKSRAPEALKKNTSKKLGVLPEDSVFADAFAEERFLHNHEECIKMQACAMSKDCFIETLGLDRGPQDGLPKQFASPWVSPVSSKVKLKSDSPTKHYLQYEEVVEVPIENQSPLRLEVSSGLDSPNPCQTPSPDQYSHWKKDQECVNFTLMESPKPFKH